MNERHYRFLKVAQEIALKSNGMRRQFGAVIVDGKRIIASGHNKRSHTKVPNITTQNGERRFWGLHAEVNALLHCDLNVRGSSVYIWGQNASTKNLVFSGPCDLCQQVLKDRGVKQAIFQMKNSELVILNLWPK